MKILNQNLNVKIIVTLVAIINFIIYFKFPIYPDEITNNYLSTIYSVYNGNKQWLINSCTLEEFKASNTILLLNWLYTLPFSFIDNNQIFRIFHLILGSILFATIIYTLKSSNNLTLNLTAILSWPLMVINSFVIIRPEYFIIIMVLSFIYSIRSRSSLSIVVLSLSFCLAINAHAKSLYFLPLILYFLITYFWNQKNKIISLLSSFFIIYVSYKYYEMYSFLSISCRYDYINSILSNYQISPFKLFSNPYDFLRGIYFSNDLIRLDRAISQIFLRNNYDIGYLPNIIKYFYITNLINMLYIYLLLTYLKNVFSSVNFNKLTYIYLLTIIAIFLLNSNKAAYDIFMYINLIILLPAFGLRHENK